ncbi:MAG: cell envelope biogenesis protein OmpA [Oxalobacteraceae bacterium]|nr:MAG: cell envelope biogenesis protein OmpA [Oxalobacteraceae bacterium]
MRIKIATVLALVAGLGLTACTDPYDPGQRAVGGGLLGAGTGAALGAVAGGGCGAAIGALAGGALGAAGGAATTQARPEPYYAQQPAYQPGYAPQPVYQPQPGYAPGYAPAYEPAPPPGYYRRGYGY